MKKELALFLAGAAAASAVWGIIRWCGGENRVCEENAGFTVNKDYPGDSRKDINAAYSGKNHDNFPGLKLYSTDFLVPLNRMAVTGYAFFDDPNDHYGSANAPTYAYVFEVAEKNAKHSFILSGIQNLPVNQLIYLGKNIRVEEFKQVGNGFIMASCKDKDNRISRGIVPISRITGNTPDEDPGIAVDIPLDPLAGFAENPDPFIRKMTAAEVQALIQQSLRKNDRETIVRMFQFPLGSEENRIYTRKEMLREFDRFFTPDVQRKILQGKPEDIDYNWQGAFLPGGICLINAYNARQFADGADMMPAEGL